jgi:hypothetical protein
MTCSLSKCTNIAINPSKYCDNHLYWDDLCPSCDMDNLDIHQETIFNKIINHIKKRIDKHANLQDRREEEDNFKILYKYLLHKKVFLSKRHTFRIVAIQKAIYCLHKSSDDELHKIANQFINIYDEKES